MSIPNTAKHNSPIDLYRHGVAVLAAQLGPADSIRFLRLLDPGSGDYTAARQTEPDDGTVQEICAEIRESEANRP